MKYQVERPAHCPRCGHQQIISVGRCQVRSLHRWRCKGCKRIFTARTPDVTRPSSLGIYLRGLREKKHLLVKDVAAAIQVSRSHVTYIENGRHRPARKVLGRLVEFLGADPDLGLQLWENFQSEQNKELQVEKSLDGN